MNDLTMEEVKQLLLDGRRAAQYAWDHYEELAAREAVYILYGPYAYGTGAAIPGKFISKSARNLTLKKPQREKYIIYELDSEYKLLRTMQVFDSVIYSTYQCFELNGIQYAYPFKHNQKKIVRAEILALSCKDDKPYYFGFLTKDSVSAHFFEYVSPERVLVTAYFYYPNSKYTIHGYLTDPDAPMGELNSAVQRTCWEEKPMYTVFSQWLRNTAEPRQENKPTNDNSKSNLSNPVYLGKMKNSKIAYWIDDVLSTNITDNIVAVCFNLYDEGNGNWSMELVGSDWFDLENEDWACNEITDFGSRKNLYMWEMECDWKKALVYMVGELTKYLENGKYAHVLKSRMAVGVGFVDGNITILHKAD